MAANFHSDIESKITARAASLAWDELPPTLVETALRAGEGRLAAGGALAVTTGVFTGRSVKDKFIVRDAMTDDKVWWDNSAAMSPAHFDTLLGDMLATLDGKALHAQHLLAGADARHELAVSVFTETAWHALFIRNLLRGRVPARPTGSWNARVPAVYRLTSVRSVPRVATGSRRAAGSAPTRRGSGSAGGSSPSRDGGG